MSLKGKKVVVIGASSGMGLAVVRAASEAGATVVAVARNRENLEKAIKKESLSATLFPADIGDEQAMEALFKEVGPYDHLVTTAASLAYAPIQQFDTAAAQRIISSKLLGPFFAAKCGSRKISKDGSITFFSGVAAWKPAEGASMVAAVNGALAALARSLAVELAPVRVNAISPGIVDTPSWDAMPEPQRKAFFQAMSEKLPVRRTGRSEDLADAALFLMNNGFTTGIVLHVEGGHTLV